MDNLVTKKDILHGKYLDILSSIESRILSGYDLGMVLYNETWYAIEGKRSIVKDLLLSLPIRQCSIDSKINNLAILTVASFLNRTDHDNYWNSICADAGEHDDITFFYPKDIKSVIENFDIIHLPTKLHWMLVFLKELRVIKPIRNRVYLALQLVKRKWILSQIDSMNLSPRIAMCYFDANPDESLLMLYFKKKGAITITNQHGQPVFRSKLYDRMNQSQILGFKCDYYLAKGQFTRRQFVSAGLPKDRVLLLGVVGGEFIQNNSSSIVESSNVIGVFLDCPSFPFASKANMDMISIAQNVAKKHNIKYFVRIHPQDCREKYIQMVDASYCLGIYDKSTSLTDLFPRCCATIIHATATYLDSYRNGVRAFKYKSDVFFPISNKKDEFETEDELSALIDGWFKETPNVKEDYIRGVFSDYDSGWYPQKTQELLRKLIK